MRSIIFGTGQFAEIAKEYSNNTTSAFTVEQKYCKTNEFLGLPLIPFEEIEKHYPPENYELITAIVYGDLNRTRERIFKQAKDKGYSVPSKRVTNSFIADNVQIGEGCYIFEGNVIQTGVKIGNNVILWSSNHQGHHSILEDNVFISSHVVISGNCKIGRNCFIGVNATIGDGVTVGEYSWISPGAIVTKDVPPHSLVKSIKSEVIDLDETRLFK